MISLRFTYDSHHNIAYICFREKQAEVETIRISDELIVDMAPDGTIYGIELLNANEQLWREEPGRLLFVNEATSQPANHQFTNYQPTESRRKCGRTA